MFEYLKKYEVKDQITGKVEMPELGDDAFIIVRPSGEKNKGYFNAVLRKNTRSRTRRIRVGRFTAEDMKESRNEDRKLFPQFVIVGWSGVCDQHGNEVLFSVENATELCEQLPDELFDRVREFAASPEAFYPDDDAGPDSESVEELAGN